MALGAAAFVLMITVAPGMAGDQDGVAVMPAAFTPAVAMKRQATHFQSDHPLTDALLAAYVERQKALRSFDAFGIGTEDTTLTEGVVSSYIARRRNEALDAIATVDVTARPALTAKVLSSYAETDFVPTAEKVAFADGEKRCLAQAIYHEARGESEDGQLAVANVIINRALSAKYPSTLCGVVFQNADKGRYRCQFTFACDGRPDSGTERGAWNRSMAMADAAYHKYQRGERPGVVPNSVLYYHTTAVAPKWSHSFRRVAAIGAHIFYASN